MKCLIKIMGVEPLFEFGSYADMESFVNENFKGYEIRKQMGFKTKFVAFRSE